MSGVTLYLGDQLTILNSDVSFNSANVFVQAPTVGLHVANKNYVDMADQLLRDLITNQSAESVAAYAQLMSLITTLQAENTDLSTQVDNLYLYFFDQHRDGPVPSRA